jgi:lipoate---protein ligase
LNKNSSNTVRFLNLGLVDPVRSQTCYHTVAYTMTPESPDTILLVSPTRPYVSIGFHQDPQLEVDLDYCRAKDLPIVRREVGGGAVYLDAGQIFIQWIFHADALPVSIEERFALYIQPILDTYASLGIKANYRPINDIHVSGKKIGGTGAAQIGLAQIVVGSLMFDFDKKTMSQVLKVSSEKMRDKVFQSLEEYMTTMREQLGFVPDIQSVVQTYAKKCEDALHRPLAAGGWTEVEEAKAAELDKTFASEDWLYLKSRLNQPGIKIHAGVSIGEAQLKAAGGLMRTIVRLENDKIDDITITGDFTMLPLNSVTELENGLKGKPASAAAIRSSLDEVYAKVKIQSPGVTPADLATVVADAVERGKMAIR